MEQEELQNTSTENFLATTRDVREVVEENYERGDSSDVSRDVIENSDAGDDAEKAAQQVVTETEELRPTTFAKVEKSLASLGFFTPSSRRIKDQKIKRISFTREEKGKRIEVSAEIHPSGFLGLPITADQDKYLALQQIITDTLQADGKITNPIRFKSADLLRLLNTSRKSGKNYKEVSEWLDVMSATSIFSDGAVYVAGQKRFVRDRLHVFDRAVSVGKELEDGTIADANYVWLSAWQLENINNKFLIPIDLEAYRELKNHIAKALVPLLQIWLFASNKVGSFEKRYDELCEMLTLQTYRSPSHIRRQFQPSLDELAHHQYLEKWRIEKTSDRKAYKIVLFHGAKFHRDRRKRLAQKGELKPSVVVAEYHPIDPPLPEPGRPESDQPRKVATWRDQPKVGQVEGREIDGHLVDQLAARGLLPSTSLKLLQSLSPERLQKVSDCIDYWDSQKKVKAVGEGLLYELIRNSEVPTSFETAKQRTDRQAIETRKMHRNRIEELVKARYEEFCRLTTDRFVAAAIPTEEMDRRVAAYKEGMLAESGYWREKPKMAEDFARHGVRAEVEKGLSLPSYEKFYRQQLPKVLAEMRLDPIELGIESDGPALVGEEGIPQNDLDGPPANGLPVMEDSAISEEKSSPYAI